MRVRAKVDLTQAAIVGALRDMGCSVWLTHQLGDGAPDCVVGYRGQTALAEIKRSPKARVTPDQKQWHGAWRGSPVVILDSINAAVSMVKAMGKR